MQQNIPLEILDLIEKKPFSALTNAEKNLVSEYLTAEAYQDLHLSAQMTKQYLHQNLADMPSERVLGQLQADFRAEHQAKSVFFQPISFWKAAAAVFLLTCAWLVQLFYAKSSLAPEKLVYVHDTVEITQIVKERDTFFQYLPIEVSQKKANKPNNGHHFVTNKKEKALIPTEIAMPIPANSSTKPIPSASDIHTLTAYDFDKALQKGNGKNRQEDSLSKQFGFVSM